LAAWRQKQPPAVCVIWRVLSGRCPANTCYLNKKKSVIGQLKFIQKMRKSTFCTGTNTGTIIQKLLGTFLKNLDKYRLGSKIWNSKDCYSAQHRRLQITKWRQVLP
jgi:hypothetical protein